MEFLHEVKEHGGMVITRGEWVRHIMEYQNNSPEPRNYPTSSPMYRYLTAICYCDGSGLSEPALRRERRLKAALAADPGNAKLQRKLDKLTEKQVVIFYSRPKSNAQPAEADGAEGTPQP